MDLRQAALIALASTCVTISVAQAETIETRFVRIEAAASHYTLQSKSGDYTIGAKTYARYKKIIKALKPGAEIVITVKGDGKTLTSIKRKSGGPAAIKASVEGVFARFDDKSQRIWLQNGGNYALGKVAGRTLAKILTLKPKQPVRLLLIRDLVVDLALIKRGGAQELAGVKTTLDASHPNDEVQLRKLKDPQFYEFKVKTVRASEIVLIPRVGGRYTGSVTIRRSEIAEVVNPAAAKRIRIAMGGGVVGPKKKDPFLALGARIGDMIGVAFKTGQLIDLDEKTYTLRGFRNNRWETDPKPKPRLGAKGIRYEVLDHTQSFNVEGGQISVEIKRSRHGQLKFEVVLSHNLKTALLVGFEVQFLLSRKPCMKPDAKPDGVVVKKVQKAMFVEQRHQIVQVIPGDDFLDGRVHVKVLPRHVIDLSATDAKAHLIGALEHWNRPLEELAGALRATAANGDPNLCRVLIGYSILLRDHLRSGKNPTERDADLELELRKALDGFGELAPRLIMETLFGQDRRLRHWVIRGGGIEQATLPQHMKAVEYKRALIQLMAQLKIGLKGATGRRLFTFYLARSEDFKEDILQAFRGHPEAGVESLLHVAIDITDRETSDRAAILLRGLGEPILPALFADLRARKVDPSRLEQQLKSGKKNPDAIVSLAVDLLLKKANDDAKRERLRQVELAAEARAQGDFIKALEIVRAVLASEKRHPEASKLLPSILLDQGQRFLNDGKRGQAALALQESAANLTGPAKLQPNKILAVLLVDAAEEEIDAMVIRAAPHAAAELVAEIKPGDQLESTASNASAFDEWVSVQKTDGTQGFARSKILSKAPSGFRTTSKVTPFAILEEQLKRAQAMGPGTTARIKILMGRLAAREGEIRYKNNEFEAALAFFEIAKRDAPDDPRLSQYWGCWAQANTGMLGGVAAVVLLGFGFGVLGIVSRPKKVQFAGEYQHYGQERARETGDPNEGEEG
ncbi:MAG: hypothetical protein JKY65_21970 [Planctomycetes bacterium]|nr:hypothetical protein [Planctomycetota bacterium]